MADIEFKVDEQKLWALVCRSDGTYDLVRSAADGIAAKANALGAGYRTARYHRDHESPAVGGTKPEYGSNTGRPRGVVPVGLVYTANYAAQKDNHLHNTLLKSI